MTNNLSCICYNQLKLPWTNKCVSITTCHKKIKVYGNNYFQLNKEKWIYSWLYTCIFYPLKNNRSKTQSNVSCGSWDNSWDYGSRRMYSMIYPELAGIHSTSKEILPFTTVLYYECLSVLLKSESSPKVRIFDFLSPGRWHCLLPRCYQYLLTKNSLWIEEKILNYHLSTHLHFYGLSCPPGIPLFLGGINWIF